MTVSTSAAPAVLPCRKPLSFQTVQTDLLVHDPAAGRVHFLNGSAALIWVACDGSVTLEQCAERLRSAFAIPPHVELLEDIRESLLDFDRRGLLAG